jgi:hypothetical protein
MTGRRMSSSFWHSLHVEMWASKAGTSLGASASSAYRHSSSESCPGASNAEVMASYPPIVPSEASSIRNGSAS